MPYLDTEEVCEDVEFQECVDAEVQVRQTEQCNGSVNVIFLLMVGGTPCRHWAGIQNGSRDTGLSRAFLNGQFRL